MTHDDPKTREFAELRAVLIDALEMVDPWRAFIPAPARATVERLEAQARQALYGEGVPWPEAPTQENRSEKL